MQLKRNNLHFVVLYFFTCFLYCVKQAAAVSRVSGTVTSQDIVDGSGDHYLVLSTPTTPYSITFDKEYDVDFFLLGGGGGGADNRGGAGGSGAAIIFMNYRVEKDKAYQFIVGAKGARGAANGNNGADSTVTVDSTTIFNARGGGGGSVCCGGASGLAGGSSGSSGTYHLDQAAGTPEDPRTDNIIPASNTGTTTIQSGPTTDSTLRYRVMGNAPGFSNLPYSRHNAQLDSDGAGGIGSAGSPRIKYTDTTKGQPGRGGDGAAGTTVQNVDIDFKDYFSASSVLCTDIGVLETDGDCYFGGGGHGSTTCNDFTASGVENPKSIRSLGGGGLSSLTDSFSANSYQNSVNAIGRGSGGAGGQGFCGGTTGAGGDGSDGLIMIRIKEYCPTYYESTGGSKTCTACSPPTATLDAGLAHWLRFEDGAALNFDSITGGVVGTISGSAGTTAQEASAQIGKGLRFQGATTGGAFDAKFDITGLGFFANSDWTVSLFCQVMAHKPTPTTQRVINIAKINVYWTTSDRFYVSADTGGIVPSGATTATEIDNTKTPEPSNILHLAFVFNCDKASGVCRDTTSTITVYHNGAVVANFNSKPVTATHLHTVANQKIELGHMGTGNYMNGWIDDLRIYNRALTAAEVATLAGQTSSADEISPCTCSSPPVVGLGGCANECDASDKISTAYTQYRLVAASGGTVNLASIEFKDSGDNVLSQSL